MRSLKLAALLLISILMLGCIGDKELSQARLLCLDLASYSESEVPFCTTQEKCFEEVQVNFAIEKEGLPEIVKEKLSELENHLARSWLYYNRAIVNIKYIYASCYKSDFSAVEQQANEFSHNAVAAFDESDKAHQIAFAILALERADLESQDINLIKEEDLYNDYSVISENMVALSGKGEGTSFTSAYLRAAENLHAAVSKFSFSEKHVAEFTVFDFISNVDGKILKNLPNKPLYLPIVSASMQDLVSYLSSAFSAEQAISVLQAA